MKRKPKITSSVPLIAIMAGLAISTTAANAQGTFTDNGATQPAFDGADQGYFNPNSPSTAAGQDKWFYENSGAGQPKGQTFTVTSPVEVKAMSYRLRTTNKPPTVDYLIRIGAVDTATNTFHELHSETITQTTNWGIKGVTDDSIGTWTLASPVTLPALPAGTVYGFDLTMTSNTTGWPEGIPYPLYENSDVFVGGNRYSTPLGGAAGIPTDTMQMVSTSDREFHLDMDATTITDTTAPTLTSVDDQVGGGPIYTDVVQVAYILNFDDAIDASTIDITDFENLGTGVSLDSVVSVEHLTPFPVASSIKIVFGVSGSGTLQLGVKSTTDIADHYTNTLTSPVGDDTTITVIAGTTPNDGIRYWDGTITSGVTDGVSQGGSGTWDTTTTNWDRGFGFAGPVAWNNANNDTAILGGANGTVTLAEPITVGGLQIDNRNIDITGSTLTFGVAGEINSTSVGNQNDPPIISSVIAGAAVTKTGGGYLNLDADNTMASFNLNAGTIGQLPNSTDVDPYLGFGTGVLTINGGGLFSTNNDPTYIPNDMVWNANWFANNVSNGSKILTFGGNVTLGTNVTISSKHTMHLDGVISDGGNNYQLSLQDNGGGANFHLNGANTFGGGVDWKEDNLTVNNASGLGTGTFIISGSATNLDNVSGGALTLSTNNVQAWNSNFTFVGTNDLNMGTGAVTMSANRTITVNAGTLTIGGPIGPGSQSLTKAGAGTLALGGTNTYTGNTAVNVGTLALVGGSQSSAITVATGASLGFTVGSSVTSTAAVDLTNGTVKITGTPTLSSHLLMTADLGITGTPTLDAPISGYALAVVGNELRLNATGAGTPYENWATGNELFSDDANGDGVSNGQAFLLGASDPNVSALGLLPAVSETGGGLVMTFSMLNSGSRGTAALNVEHSSDLGITDAWTTVLVPETNATVSGVTFTVTPNGSLNDVVATISSSEAAAGKLFGRLKATE